MEGREANNIPPVYSPDKGYVALLPDTIIGPLKTSPDSRI